MKYYSLIIFSFLISCRYNEPLENHELIVPPFIQVENPDLYEIFKPEDQRTVSKKSLESK